MDRQVQARINEIEETLATYRRNYTCLEMCDREKMEDLEKELDALENGSEGWSDADITAVESSMTREEYNRVIMEHDL